MERFQVYSKPTVPSVKGAIPSTEQNDRKRKKSIVLAHERVDMTILRTRTSPAKTKHQKTGDVREFIFSSNTGGTLREPTDRTKSITRTVVKLDLDLADKEEQGGHLLFQSPPRTTKSYTPGSSPPLLRPRLRPGNHFQIIKDRESGLRQSNCHRDRPEMVKNCLIPLSRNEDSSSITPDFLIPELGGRHVSVTPDCLIPELNDHHAICGRDNWDSCDLLGDSLSIQETQGLSLLPSRSTEPLFVSQGTPSLNKDQGIIR